MRVAPIALLRFGLNQVVLNCVLFSPLFFFSVFEFSSPFLSPVCLMPLTPTSPLNSLEMAHSFNHSTF